MNYYRRPKKTYFSEEEYYNNKLKSLRDQYGTSLKRPNISDYGLSEDLCNEISSTNIKIASWNRKRLYLKIFLFFLSILINIFLFFVLRFFLLEYILHSDIFFVFFLYFILYLTPTLIFKTLNNYFIWNKPNHPLSSNIEEYNKMINEYPGEIEIKTLLKKIEKIKNMKRYKDYWFSLSGLEFEEEMTNLLKKYDYAQVTKTKSTGDGGVDIILIKKDGTKIFVECKAHKKPIGPHVVRGLYGAMKDGNADAGAIISLSGLTEGAINFIKDKKIKVWTIEDLVPQTNKD